MTLTYHVRKETEKEKQASKLVKSLQMVTAALKLKDAYSLEEKL